MLVRRVMTSDVAQAVEALRAALMLVDKMDRAIASARTPVERGDLVRMRERDRAQLRRARAELDAVLLGEDDG